MDSETKKSQARKNYTDLHQWTCAKRLSELVLRIFGKARMHLIVRVISCQQRWSIELGRLVDICTGQACSSCIERTSIGLDISGKGWRRSLSPNRDHAEKAVRSRWRLRPNVRPTSALQEPNNVGEKKKEYAGSPWQLGHGIGQHLVSFGKRMEKIKNDQKILQTY